jgi:hypothetical protein
MADASPASFTLKSVLLGIVCILVANLLLVALKTTVGLPLAEGVLTAIATIVGVLAWFFIGARIRG